MDFIRTLMVRLDRSQDAEAIVGQLLDEEGPLYPFALGNFAAGRRFEEAEPEFRRLILMAMLAWHKDNAPAPHQPLRPKAARERWKMLEAFDAMLKSKLAPTEPDLIALLDWSAQMIAPGGYYKAAPRMIKLLSVYLKDNALTEPLEKAVRGLVEALGAMYISTERLRWIQQLKSLVGDTKVDLPFTAGDIWADAAAQEIRLMDGDRQAAWAELLLHCLKGTGSAPGRRWGNAAEKYAEAAGGPAVFECLLRWFPLVDKPRQILVHAYDRGETLLPVNADILKGLVWLCVASSDPAMARALGALALSAYRRIPMSGPRAGKVGNACFWALGQMPGPQGAAQLSILKSKIHTASARKAISNALAAIALREGIRSEDLEEMLVPVYGMQQVGFRRDDFGEAASEIRITGSSLEQQWVAADGTALAAMPRSVKENHSEELKDLAQAARDIRKMLAAQRERIDQLYLVRRAWDLPAWQARYLDHPLTGTIARRLIWKFTGVGWDESGIWMDGKIVGRDGRALDWLDRSTQVELWHPLDASVDVVLEWRQWLAQREIRQPFKQAHREIYLLTDAERQTRLYSNRYAAHILRQHQFHSLCAARGWKNSLRLMVDDDFPPARKLLPAWGLRAEYWVEGIGDQYGTDTNQAGTYLYLTTDQVRFYHIEAGENRAHAAGGGYETLRRRPDEPAEPLPLGQIPPLVFSEIMRDVDLFVGVASVGSDPTWLDGGSDVRYRDYWHGFSFGELTESAKTRRAALEQIVPRLKIAARCSLTDRFLVVRGDIRTYKIHLGSGNILMEPNDQYLCIVPARGGPVPARERVFIPFEGDGTLAVILSKALLLADDRKITDPTITRQLQR